jgi:hypothetical protein
MDILLKKSIIGFICLLVFCIPSSSLFGQNDDEEYEDDYVEKESYNWSHKKEIGLNFSPLISQMIPFNLGSNDAGFSSFIFKRYGRKIAFRLNAGIEFNLEEDNFEDGFALFTVGFERRRQITKKITFATGTDFGLFGFFDDDPFFNISPFYGFEYNFNDAFFAVAEGNLQFLFGDGIRILVNPPVAVFFYVRI